MRVYLRQTDNIAGKQDLKCLLFALLIFLVYLEGKEAGEVAMASNSDGLFTSQYYSLMGSLACQDG